MELYGSLHRLLDELLIIAIRAGIAEADSSVEQSGAPDALEPILTAAWQTSATIFPLATIASQKHLPLWTTA